MSKILIVTGASRGIGAACAKLAGRQGYRVCVNYNRSADEAAAVVEAIERDGGSAIAIQADVAEEAEVVRLFAAVDEALGPVTHLVNNAGIILPLGTIGDVTAESLNRLWQINITSAFICAREAVARMTASANPSGCAIVNISSAAARMGGGGQFINYAASKGALDTFSFGLAQELASTGVRVNSVRPGLIDTEIHASAGWPSRVADLAATVPMRRAGSADEVAEAVLWLLSDASSYVTGTIVDVTGGR